MGIFWLGPLMAPLLGPIIGGVLAKKFGWRSTQWFLALFGLVLVLVIFFALPETRKDFKSLPEEAPLETVVDLQRISTRQSIQKITKRWVKITKRVLIDPLKIVLYLRHPALLLTITYASIAFGTLYLLNISIEATFSRAPHSFSTVAVGLAYLPNSMGYLLATICCSGWSDTIMIRKAKRDSRYDGRGKLIYHPEDRMGENVWIGAFLYPAALVWYGWTAEKECFWLVPVRYHFLPPPPILSPLGGGNMSTNVSYANTAFLGDKLHTFPFDLSPTIPPPSPAKKLAH